MQNNRRHFATVAVLVVISTFLVYWLLDSVLAWPIQASAEALQIDYLFDLHVWLIAFLFSLVVVFMLYALVVFRQRKGEEEKEGEYFHSNVRLEVAWTVLPLIFVVYYAYLGTTILTDITRPAPDEHVVNVVGFQWGWRFEYPDTGLVTQELVLPVDRRVRLDMTSTDVLHSFWVVEFRVKQDTVPGQITHLRLTPTEIGDYKLRCAELCGLSHAYMLADVRVVSADDFDAWMAERTAPRAEGEDSLAEQGALLALQNACVGCHSADGTQLAGPTWQGLYGHDVQLATGETVVADEEYLYNSIVDPNSQITAGYPANVMPQNYGEVLSDEEIAAIIEYIKTLQ
jgi:cytochrome c oxidase subunit II